MKKTGLSSGFGQGYPLAFDEQVGSDTSLLVRS